ncbi:MAG: hybrid sensor histidine kinase/response regulator, partial [Bacteroidota bacterium]
PGLDGIETCRFIKSVPEYCRIPVLFLSAYGEMDRMIEGIRAGAVDYLLKPFNRELLLTKIRVHLDLRQKNEALRELNANLERKVLERTLELEKANKELMQLDSTKSEFLNIISHELRTPLNGILGVLQLLKEESFRDMKTLFLIMENSVSRLERFSYNALLITSLRTGRHRLNIETRSLGNLISEVCDTFSGRIKEKRIRLEKEFADGPPVVSDPQLIRRSLEIVIDNALKFSTEDSDIYVSLRPGSSSYMVEIQDSGPGFSKKALDRIFHVFCPGETFVNENEGIELALCSQILSRLGGEIQVFNNQGGALVKLIYPYKSL